LWFSSIFRAFKTISRFSGIVPGIKNKFRKKENLSYRFGPSPKARLALALAQLLALRSPSAAAAELLRRRRRGLGVHAKARLLAFLSEPPCAACPSRPSLLLAPRLAVACVDRATAARKLAAGRFATTVDSPPPSSAGPSRGRHEIHVDALHLFSPSPSHPQRRSAAAHCGLSRPPWMSPPAISPPSSV
jgi:hypothetical protein